MKLPDLTPLATRVILVGTLGVSVAAAGTVLWRHYSGLVNAKAELTAKAARLEYAVDTQKAVTAAREHEVEAWRQASQVQVRALELQATSQAAAGEYLQEIKRVQAKHDLAALARAKPALIETHINAGIERALRLLERASRPDAPADTGFPAPGASPAPSPAGKP